jgi:hypothetical protein
MTVRGVLSTGFGGDRPHVSSKLFFLGICGVIWVALLWQLIGVWRARSWPTAPAVAVDVQRMTMKNSDGPDRVRYAPVLRFWVPERGQLEAVPDYWSTRPAAQVGEQVTIRYDPADPERIQLVGARKSGALLLIFVSLIAIPAFAVLFLAM